MRGKPSGATALRTAFFLAMCATLAIAGACAAPARENATYRIAIAEPEGIIEFEIDSAQTAAPTAIAGLEYLRDAGKIELECEKGPFGTWLSRVGKIRPDRAGGEYIAIYTSVEKDFDASQFKKTREYGGVRLASSGLGIDSMRIENGAVIFFVAERFDHAE